MEKECLLKKRQLQDNHLCQVFFKRKNDDKAIDEGEALSKVPTFNEDMLDKGAEEDEVKDDVKELIVKIVSESKDEEVLVG